MSRVIKVRYENRVLKPLKSVKFREGEKLIVGIRKSVKERLKDLIGILRESSGEELIHYLEKFVGHGISRY